MLFKLFDFPIFNYFWSRNDFNGITIFDTLDSQKAQNLLDTEKPFAEGKDSEPFCETGPRDFMLKVPDSSGRNSPDEWSQHPFVRPNFSTTTKTYKGPMSEWLVETKVSTFSSTSEQLNSEFLGLNFFGSDSGPNFLEPDSEPNLFGADSGPNLFGSRFFGSHFFGPGFDQDFFGSHSNSTNDNFSSNSREFPFSNEGPVAMFDMLFGMLQHFQHFADSLDPYKPMGPPRI